MEKKNEFKIQIEDDSEIMTDYNQLILPSSSSSSLYKWQQQATDFFFNHDGYGLFTISTGAGKTFFSVHLIKKIWEIHPDYNILIVVPKNVILETGWYKELSENGILITKIGVYYGDIKEYAQITLTNMQNLHRIPLDYFDIGIFDEVHNYGTKKLLPYLKHNFKYKIGLTATVERNDDAHYDIIDAFNDNVFDYSAESALQDGVLNPFDFYNIGVELDDNSETEYEELTNSINTILSAYKSFNSIMRLNTPIKGRFLSLLNSRKQLVNNYPRKFDIVKAICVKNKTDKIIVFSQFNEQTNKIYWYLLDIGVTARIIHSGINKQDRDKNLIDFKNNKFNVLLTSKVLDEGYNLPSIDTAIITAGDSTAKQTIQRMGRVLRRKNHKSKLYQIYCSNTIEEKQSIQRSMMFKNLCDDFKEYFYGKNDTEIIL